MKRNTLVPIDFGRTSIIKYVWVMLCVLLVLVCIPFPQITAKAASGTYQYTSETNPISAAGSMTDDGSSRYIIDIDLEGDSDRDFIAYYDTTDNGIYDGSYQFFVNNGSGSFSRTEPAGITLPLSNASNYLCADFNNDGYEDIFVSEPDPDPVPIPPDRDDLTYFKNDGSGNFTSEPNPLVAAGALAGNNTHNFTIDIDLEGDGDRDFIAYYDAAGYDDEIKSSGAVYDGSYQFFVNNGSGSFSRVEPTGITLPLKTTDNYLCVDFDNDGDEDIYAPGAYFENDGSGNFTSATNPVAKAGAMTDDGSNRYIVDIDIDSDGDIDFIAYDSSIYAFYMNDGSGSFSKTTPAITLPLKNAAGYLCTDFDNDGDDDIFAPGAYYTQSISDTTAPTIDTKTALNLDEGATSYLTSSQLSSSDDTDGAANITYTVTTAPANGILNMSTFTQAQLDAGNVVSYTHDDSEATSDSFVFTVADSSGNEVTNQTFNITISPVNDDPTISGLPTDIVVTEDTASNVDLSAATFADSDSGSASVSLTITSSAGTLSASSGGGVTVSGSGTSTLSLTGTATNIDTFLNTASNISYTGAANINGNDAATLTLTANDGGNTGAGGGTNVALGTVNVDITAVNDEPSLTATATDPTFTEGGAAATLFTNASASTGDTGQTITGLTLTVTNVTGGSNEVLIIDGSNVALTNGNTLTTLTNSISCSVSVTSNTATVTLGGGSLTTAQTQTLVNGMAYRNTSNDPDTNNRIVTLTSLRDSGGTSGGGDDTAALSIASTVTVTAVNDDPTITGLPTDITVTEDTASNVNLSAATFADSDSGFASVSLTITSSTGTLSASSGGGVTVSGSGTSALSLTGTAANIDAFLNSASNISYTGAANSSGNDAATLTLTANDGGNTGAGGGTNVALGTVNVDITAVNDAPTIATNIGLTLDEGATAAIPTSKLSATDVDTDDSTLTFTITDAPDNGTLKNNGSTVALSGTFTQQNLIDDKIQYVHNGSNTISDSFVFKVSDGTNELQDVTFDITVNAVDDDTPTIVNNNSITLDEGAAAVISISKLSATDVDTDDATLDFVITTIPVNGHVESTDDPGVAIISFTQQNLVDGEIKYVHDGGETTSDSFTFKVSDGTNELTGQTFSITVNPMPDPPTISVNVGLTISEGGGGSLKSKLVATDIDSNDDTLVFTVTAAPANGSLSMTTFTQTQLDAGSVTYTHDDSNTTADSFTFKVSDGTNELTDKTFSITVNAVDDDVPTVSVNTGLTLDEGATEDISITELSATDTDTVDTTLKFVITTIPVNGQVESTDDPGVAITSFTQQNLIDGKIRYVHDGSDTTADSFTFKVADTNGNELTGLTFDITVNPVDDTAPTMDTNDRLTLDEGTSESLQTVLVATDTEDADTSLTFTVTDLPDNGTLNMTTFTQAHIDAGNVTYTHNGSETTSDSFTFKVADTNGNELTGQTFDITVNAVDDTAPTMETNDGLTLDEGASESLQTVLVATDTEEADTNLTFTVTDLPDNGTLSLTTFTQAQIDDGSVTYTHDGSDTTADSFTFNVTDTSGNDLTNQTFNITINPIDDAMGAPTVSPTPAQTADTTPSATNENTITSSVVEQDEETGTVTIEIEVSDLPPATVAIEMPDGSVVAIDGETTITLDIKQDDLDEEGNISIIALDDENTPLGSYDVQVEKAAEAIRIPDARDEWSGFAQVLVWILIGIAGIAVIGGLIYFVFKRRSNKEE